jgi:membrane protease YdiL (CAAX protease family)
MFLLYLHAIVPHGRFRPDGTFQTAWPVLAMTFAYGVMLGAIRRISKGMLAPLVTHLAADMTIFSTVLFLYFRIQSGS